MSRRRPLFFLFVGFIAGAASLGHAAEVELLRVWPGWRDAEHFERIGEYFGRRENPGSQTILRSEKDVRSGYYFLVRVKSAAAITGARFEVSVIRPDAPEPKTFTFPAALPAKESVFQLGLTGGAWPGGRKASPAAWKLTLVDAGGRVLVEQKSFLWEKPAR